MIPIYVLEAAMLLCFSVSWYCSVFHMLRVKAAAGKSPAFVLLICIGYTMGVMWKLTLWQETGILSPVTWLYAWNGMVVAVDLALVLHYTRRSALRSQPADDTVQLVTVSA
jgi:hypothetical protein